MNLSNVMENKLSLLIRNGGQEWCLLQYPQSGTCEKLQNSSGNLGFIGWSWVDETESILIRSTCTEKICLTTTTFSSLNPPIQCRGQHIITMGDLNIQRLLNFDWYLLTYLYGYACEPAMISLGGTLGCKLHNEYYSSTLILCISKNLQYPLWVVHAAYSGPHIHCPRRLSPPPAIPCRNLWVRGCTASFCAFHYPKKSYKCKL